MAMIDAWGTRAPCGLLMFIALALLLLAASLTAQPLVAPAAVITHATGTASIRMANGTIKAAFVDTELMIGDLLTLEENSSARIRFVDGTELVLRPGTRIRIQSFSYIPAEPEADQLEFELVRGGLRAITGAIGRRGQEDAFQGRTVVGTIGVRGTQFGMVLCEPGQCDTFFTELPPVLRERVASGGLFFEATDGVIAFSNEAGVFLFRVNQWGFADSPLLPPIVVDTVPFPLRSWLPLIAPTQSVGGFSAGLGLDPFAQCELR